MLNSGSPLFGRVQPDNEIDALQTDVMRFLAIIALCLLAVFAAVSSEMPQSAREMMDVQSNVIAALKQDLREARDQHAQASAQLQQREETLAVQDAQLETQRHNTEDQLNVVMAMEQLKVEADALAAALNESDARLQAVLAERGATQQDQQASSEQLGDLQQQLRRAHDKHQADAAKMLAMEERLEEITERSSQLRAENQQLAVQQAEPQPESIDTTTTESRPLSLHFESQRVLMTLVRAGRVDLLAMAGGQIWRYEPRVRGFESVNAADQVNFIDQVPADVAALAQVVTGSNAIQWGVVMDSTMLARLTELIAEVDGGEIVVDVNGGLNHRP